MKFKEINSIFSPKYHLPGSMAQRSIKKASIWSNKSITAVLSSHVYYLPNVFFFFAENCGILSGTLNKRLITYRELCRSIHWKFEMCGFVWLGCRSPKHT